MSETIEAIWNRYPWQCPRYSRMTVLAAYLAGCTTGCLLVLLGYLIIDGMAK